MHNNVSNFFWMQVTNQNREKLLDDCVVNTVISSDAIQFVSMKISYPNYLDILHKAKDDGTRHPLYLGTRGRKVLCVKA